MNPLFRIDFSISDSLKIVRKSVLIYETIINNLLDKASFNLRDNTLSCSLNSLCYLDSNIQFIHIMICICKF